MNFSELMDSIGVYVSKFKSLSKLIDKIVNSARTPEEFLISKELPPSLRKIHSFFEKYDLRQIIRVQLFNSKINLFIHGNTFGFSLKIQYSKCSKELLSKLFSHKYPDNSTMSISLVKLDVPMVYLTVNTTDNGKLKYSRRAKQQQLMSIFRNIINDFRNAGVDITLMRPNNLINHIDTLLVGHEFMKDYDSEKYLYEQLNQSRNNQISHDSMHLANRNMQVFYTKQYPNISTEQIDNPIGLFMRELDDTELSFIYSLNINLGISKTEPRIYEFSTAFVLIDCNENLTKTIVDYFKQQYSWLIYPNLIFPFQQFFDTIPFQYDFETAKRQSQYSITQKFPINKIIELIPLESSNEYEN